MNKIKKKYYITAMFMIRQSNYGVERDKWHEKSHLCSNAAAQSLSRSSGNEVQLERGMMIKTHFAETVNPGTI